MFDLAIIGGGINGCGIARDAAGRGLSVVLIEQHDLASATSQWSTKLIHGGLRYLEHREFRLVRESLREREVLLKLAPHLVHPMSFLLPHEPHMRAAWMLRAGLFLYDRLGGTQSLPRSFAVKLPHEQYAASLQRRFHRGFVYADAQVDDARLTVANALSAQEEGATILTRSRLVAAERAPTGWKLGLTTQEGARTLEAKAVVNATGPWAADVLAGAFKVDTSSKVKLVKGSHIVVPRIHEMPHAWLLQPKDGRVVFVIPWEGRYSLIGTTDVPVASANEKPSVSDEEERYLIDTINGYLAKPLFARDIVWRYAGVRPLYDDGDDNPSAVTRDYVLESNGDTTSPLITLYGGKLTTYRRLAEHVMDKLKPAFPKLRDAWTAEAPLPGGALDGYENADAYARSLVPKHTGVPPDFIARLVHRHGDRAARVLAGVKTVADMGEIFGLGLNLLCEREIEYLIAHEWALSAEDILWRRTKCGLHMDADEQARATAFIEQKLKHKQ